MKEIIYLDTKLVNSLLAQLDQGLILKQISEENSTNGNIDEVSTQSTSATTGEAGFAPFVKANATTILTNTHSFTQQETENY